MFYILMETDSILDTRICKYRHGVWMGSTCTQNFLGAGLQLWNGNRWAAMTVVLHLSTSLIGSLTCESFRKRWASCVTWSWCRRREDDSGLVKLWCRQQQLQQQHLYSWHARLHGAFESGRFCCTALSYTEQQYQPQHVSTARPTGT